MADNLPAGFTLDPATPAQQRPATDSGLPAGFTLDPAPPRPGFIERAKDLFTGHLRTEYPDAPEFNQQAMQLTPEQKAGTAALPEWGSPEVMRSAITSDPKAAWDILSRSIPGLEGKTDKFGNLMLRAPGQKDWAYLNKPGFSERDVDELGTQTLATLPFLGTAGAGKTVGTRIATGGGSMAAGEAFRQTLEQAAGSDQGYKPTDIAVQAGLGAVTAPGVLPAAGNAIKEGFQYVTNPMRNVARGLTEKGSAEIAERKVADAFQQGAQKPHMLENDYAGYNPTGAPVGSPAEAEARARVLLRDPALTAVEDVGAAEATRVGDIGGEPTRALARWASNISPTARQRLEQVTNDRYQGQADRMMDLLRDDLATSPMTRKMSSEQIEKMADTVNELRYAGTFKDGNYGLASPQLDRIMQSATVQDALKEATKRLSDLNVSGRMRTSAFGAPKGGGDNVPTLELWDQAKRVIDAKAKMALKNGDDANAMRFGTLSQAIRNELDALVPSYRDARGTAESFFKGSNALDAGHKFASWQGRHSNEEAAAAVKLMNPNERELFARGFIDWWAKELPELRLRTNITDLFSTPAMAERFEIALGSDRAEMFLAHILTESVNDRLRKAFGNSTTARQLAEMGLIGTGASGVAGGVLGALQTNDPVGALAGVMMGVTARSGVKAASARANAQVAEQVARLLTSQDPTAVSKGLNILRQQPTMRENMVNFLERTTPAEARNIARGTAIREADDQRRQ